MAEPTKIELSPSEAAAAKEFFAWFGMTLFAACQLQYRLALFYGMSFDDPCDGCLPRVEEKIFEGLKNPFGGAVQLAKKNGVLTGTLFDDVDVAHRLRDYVAHRLFLETRSLQNEKGFLLLAERLRVVCDFFADVNNRIQERHHKVYADLGISAETIALNSKAWDESEDEMIAPEHPLPKAWESIKTAWVLPTRSGGWPVFEGDSGQLWQLGDNGLTHCPNARTAEWAPYHALKKLFPARLKSRPNP